MPWRLQAMKDVVACDKLRGVSKHTLIRRFPNGETRPFRSLHAEYIGMQSERGELKHLSSCRKRNQPRFPEEWRAKWDQPARFSISDSGTLWKVRQ